MQGKKQTHVPSTVVNTYVLNNPGDRKYQMAGNLDGGRCFLVKGVMVMITGNPLCLSFPLILE